MGNPIRSVVINAREELLSSDLNRAQQVISKAIQDEDLGDATDTTGTPINSFVRVPTLAGVAATFTAAMGDGEARRYDVSGVGVDDSAFRVLLLAAQSLTFGAPDATNPRIDLVVAQQGTVESDSSVRNILTDPVARTFAPAPVFKTSASIATVTVVAGTPGASPLPPAVPAGKVALWEVYVPAAVADAVAFGYTQRLFRRASYPMTGGLLEAPQTGVLRGCQPLYTGTFEAISQPGSPLENQVLIDGEVISFGALSGANNNDALNNPFAGAAPAGNDVPYYLYVVGGRALSQNNGGTAPCILVASLTPPDVLTGRPTAALRTARGDTSSACYVGIGFKRKNTTNHQNCQASGDLVFCTSTLANDPGFESQTLSAADNAVTLASAPSISSLVKVALGTITGAMAMTFRGTAMPTSNLFFGRTYGGALASDGWWDVPMAAGAGPHFKTFVSANALNVQAQAYKMHVRRLG